MMSTNPLRTSRLGLATADLVITAPIVLVTLTSLAVTFASSIAFLEKRSPHGQVGVISRHALDMIEDDLLHADILAVESGASGEPFVSFRVPVDVGEDQNGNGRLDQGEDEDGDGLLDLSDGDTLDAEGEPQWGCIEPVGARLDRPGDPHRVTLVFEPTRRLTEEALALDVNRDGDLDDAYRAGTLVRLTSGGDVRRLGAGLVVLPDPRRDGDRDGDGSADPLISFEPADADADHAAVVSVHLTFVAPDADGSFHVVHARRQFRARNEAP